MNMRFHGGPPYRAAVIHGGPGGIGSANGLARGLAPYCGVLEPLQGEYSVAGQVEELRRSLAGYGPLVLIGHSWGAWLAAMFAAGYPEAAGRLVAAGSGALDEKYLPRLQERRLAHLDDTEKKQYLDAIACLNDAGPDKDARLQTLGALSDKADTYCSIPVDEEPCVIDGAMYAAVWPEAAAIRGNGELLNIFRRLNCPLTVIHGDYDTTPPEAVIEPLKNIGVGFEYHILEKCGHTPWREKYGREKFFALLRQMVCP